MNTATKHTTPDASLDYWINYRGPVEKLYPSHGNVRWMGYWRRGVRILQSGPAGSDVRSLMDDARCLCYILYHGGAPGTCIPQLRGRRAADWLFDYFRGVVDFELSSDEWEELKTGILLKTHWNPTIKNPQQANVNKANQASARIQAAFDEFVRVHGREPSIRVLAKSASSSRSTVSKWLKDRKNLSASSSIPAFNSHITDLTERSKKALERSRKTRDLLVAQMKTRGTWDEIDRGLIDFEREKKKFPSNFEARASSRNLSP